MKKKQPNLNLRKELLKSYLLKLTNNKVALIENDVIRAENLTYSICQNRTVVDLGEVKLTVSPYSYNKKKVYSSVFLQLFKKEEEVYNELTNKYIPDMKKFAEKINTEFVDFKVNNRGEIVIKVLDDNKPRNITFYHPLGDHPFIKVGGEHAYYQCKNPLKKWHSAEQAIELILAKLK